MLNLDLMSGKRIPAIVSECACNCPGIFDQELPT